MTASQCWTVQVEEDENGELLLPIPEELKARLEQEGYDLSPGATVKWMVKEDGTVQVQFQRKN
jgi:hypothetical protein